MRRVVIVLGVVCFASAAAIAAQFEIAAIRGNGELEFTPAENAASYTVEWAASLPGEWHGDWSDLESIPAGGSDPIVVDIPMFYRVVATIDPLPLYGCDVIEPKLWEVSKKNGKSTEIGSTKHGYVALAADYDAGYLYGATDPDSADSVLYRVSHQTGGYEEIGSMGRPGIKGLAYDASGRRLFGITASALVLINPATGASAAIGGIGLPLFDSLAYVAGEDALYAADISSNTLWRFDPDDAAAAEIGPIGFINVSGLSYDPDLDLLYGAARSSGALITVDRSTGAGTYLGDMANTGFNGLAIYTP